MKIKMIIKQVLKYELLPIILIIVLIVCSATGILSYQNYSNVLKGSIINSAILRTQDNANLISQQLYEFKIIIEGVASRPEVRSMAWNTQKPVLIEEADRLHIKKFQVVDLNGLAVSTTGEYLNLSKNDWVNNIPSGKTLIFEPFKASSDNKIIFICAAPIKNKDGKVMGALAAGSEAHKLYDIIKNIKIGKTGYAYIMSRAGKVISYPDQKLLLQESIGDTLKNDPEFSKAYRQITSGNSGFTFYSYKDIHKFTTYAPIPDTDWVLCMSAPQGEVFKEVDSLRDKFISLTLAMIVICVFCCLLIIRYILKKKMIQNLESLVEEDKRLLTQSAELEKLRTQFFANISHEFRTPLNVILSSIQLCKFYFEKENQLQNKNMNRHLKVMKQNCYRLLRLVNNLIDTTRLDVGFLEKHVKNYNIVKIIEDITMSIEEFTENKGIKLYFSKNTDERIIACDVDKVERIMLNLISNAIKFTDPGGSISVSVRDEEESITISVSDTGIGIPDDKRKVIFDRFVQVEQTLTRNHEGSGIGLSMSKSFVEMHGGTLRVESEYGKGSEFIIVLPVTVASGDEDTARFDEVETQHRIERINIEFSDIYCS